MRTRGHIGWLTLWSAAFGVTEGAVVTYLRRVCYPDQPLAGPLFPMRNLDRALILTELTREAGTLLMLLGVAMLAERRPFRRFAAFCFCFGIWDIVYYAMLRVAIGWPASLLEWDVLFLIPAPWAAPVLAPVLVALSLVAGAWLVLARLDESAPSPLRAADFWTLGIAGLVIVWSFLWHTAGLLRGDMPADYPWWLFAIGWVAGLASFGLAWRRRVNPVRIQT